MENKKLAIILWILIIIGAIYCLFACTPTQKLYRLQKRHPYLFEAKIDTLLHKDTINVTIPGLKLDTIIHYKQLFDTVVIEKDNIKTTIWQINDTVYLNTIADTVYIEVPYEKKIPYTKYVTIKQSKLDRISEVLKSIFILILIAALIFVIIDWIKRIRK
jgi:hypothetical protein